MKKRIIAVVGAAVAFALNLSAQSADAYTTFDLQADSANTCRGVRVRLGGQNYDLKPGDVFTGVGSTVPDNSMIEVKSIWLGGYRVGNTTCSGSTEEKCSKTIPFSRATGSGTVCAYDGTVLTYGISQSNGNPWRLKFTTTEQGGPK